MSILLAAAAAGTLAGTLHLNAVSNFFAAVFGFDLCLTIIVLGCGGLIALSGELGRHRR